MQVQESCGGSDIDRFLAEHSIPSPDVKSFSDKLSAYAQKAMLVAQATGLLEMAVYWKIRCVEYEYTYEKDDDEEEVSAEEEEEEESLSQRLDSKEEIQAEKDLAQDSKMQASLKQQQQQENLELQLKEAQDEIEALRERLARAELDRDAFQQNLYQAQKTLIKAEAEPVSETAHSDSSKKRPSSFEVTTRRRDSRDDIKDDSRPSQLASRRATISFKRHSKRLETVESMHTMKEMLKQLAVLEHALTDGEKALSACESKNAVLSCELQVAETKLKEARLFPRRLWDRVDAAQQERRVDVLFLLQTLNQQCREWGMDVLAEQPTVPVADQVDEVVLEDHVLVEALEATAALDEEVKERQVQIEEEDEIAVEDESISTEIAVKTTPVLFTPPPPPPPPPTPPAGGMAVQAPPSPPITPNGTQKKRVTMMLLAPKQPTANGGSIDSLLGEIQNYSRGSLRKVESVEKTMMNRLSRKRTMKQVNDIRTALRSAITKHRIALTRFEEDGNDSDGSEMSD